MTTKGKYAVSVMCGLAGAYASESTLRAKDIASGFNLSLLYVEQILNKLKRARLINAVKGPKGGYSLSRDPKSIKIGEVIEATEGPISIVRCIDKYHRGSCRLSQQCKTRKFWSDLSGVIEEKLSSTTVADLC